MKQKILFFLFILFFPILVNAESFNIKNKTDKKLLYPSDEVTIEIKLKDIEDFKDGINAYTTTLKYDEEIFENVTRDSFESLGKWIEFDFNKDNNQLIAYTKTRIKDETDVFKLKLKVKSNAIAQSTYVSFNDFTVSEGKKDVTNSFKVKLEIINKEENKPEINKEEKNEIQKENNKEEVKDEEITKETINIKEQSKYKYYFIKGTNLVHYIGSDKKAIFKINADFSLFETDGKVYVDNKLVDRKNYNAKTGSTVIELYSSYLNTLSIGEHRITVVFNDNEKTSTKFYVKEIKEKEKEQEENKPIIKENKDKKYISEVKKKKNNISLYLIILLILLLIIVVIYKKLNKDEDKSKKINIILITILLLLIATLGYNIAAQSVKGEVNGDGKINDADINIIKRFIIGLRPIEEKYLDNADMNSDGEYTVTDLSLIITKAENNKEYKVDISEIKVNDPDGTANKNEEIVLSMSLDASYGAAVESITIDGTEYETKKEDNIYFVTIPGFNTSGFKTIDIEGVKLDNGKEVKLDVKQRIEVLKSLPSISDYEYKENEQTQTIEVSFNLNDEDDSFIEGTIKIYDKDDNEVGTFNIKKGENKISYTPKNNDSYKVLISLKANKYLEKTKIETLKIEKEITSSLDYNPSISDIKFYKKGNIIDEITSATIDEDVVLSFNFTNDYDVEIDRIVINDETYILGEDKNKYNNIYLDIKNNLEIGNNKLTITKIILTNGYIINLNEEIELKIDPRKPIISSLNVNENNDTLTVNTNILDTDNRSSSNKVIIKTANNDIITNKNISANTNQTVNANLSNIITTKYIVEVYSTYDLEDHLLERKEIEALKKVKVISSSTSKDLVAKNEKNNIEYKLVTNFDNIDALIINNHEIVNIQSSSESNLEKTYNVEVQGLTTSGLNKYILQTIKSGDTLINVNHETSVNVKKSIPTITFNEIVDNQDNNDVIFKYLINDTDGAFTNATFSLYDPSDTSYSNKLMTKTINSSNTKQTTFTLEENKEYTYVLEVNYETDPRSEENRTDSTSGTVRYTGTYTLERNYTLSINNVKITDTTFNEKAKTAKNTNLYLMFDMEYASSKEITSVKVNDAYYTVFKKDNSYYIELPNMNEAKEYKYKLEEINLNDSTTLVIDDLLDTSIEKSVYILKDEPTVENFIYSYDDNNDVSASFDLIDKDSALISSKVVVKDDNNNQIYTNNNVSKGTTNIKVRIEEDKEYLVEVYATYNNSNNNNDKQTDEKLLIETISLGDRKFELKNVSNVLLYEIDGDVTYLSDYVEVNDLAANYKNKYLAKVILKDVDSFYTTINKVFVEDDVLKLSLKYDNIVQSYKGEKTNQLIVDYGYIYDGIVDSDSISLIKTLMEEDPTRTIRLSNDLDVKSITTGNSIFPDTFQGVFDGNGHTIYNLRKPLFNSVNGVEIKNLVIENAEVRANGILANSIGEANIKNVHVTNSTIAGGSPTGALIGATNPENGNNTIEECSVSNTAVSGGKRTGIFMGWIRSTTLIKNSYVASSTVATSSDAEAAFVGEADSGKHTFENIYVDAKTKFNTNTATGGICGYTNIYMKNVLSLVTSQDVGDQEVFGRRVAGGGSINRNSSNVYELASSTLASDASHQAVTEVEYDDIKTKSFFKERLGWDETIWDFSGIENDNLPRLRNNDPRNNNNEQQEEHPSIDVFIPNYNELNKLSGFDNQREMIYSNMYKLMPYYESKYLVIDGNKISKNDLLNQQSIKTIVPYNEDGKVIVGLSLDNKNSISYIKVLFENDEIRKYPVQYKNVINNIANYTIPSLNGIGYNYNKYLVDKTTTQYNNVLQTFLNTEYSRLDALTDEQEVRNYVDNYSKAKTKAEEFTINLIANNTEYNNVFKNDKVNNLINQELDYDDQLYKLLYTYNYFDRLYDIDVSGFNLRDFVMFDSSIIEGDLNTLDLTYSMFNKYITTDNKGNQYNDRLTNRHTTFYDKNIKTHLGNKSISDLIEHLLIYNDNEIYKNDANEWFKSAFDGYVYEGAAEDHKDINSDTFLEYRAWPKMKQHQELILPFLTYHGDDLYLATVPTAMTMGNLRRYFNKPWEEVTKQEVDDLVIPFFDSVAVLYNTLSSVVSEDTFLKMNKRADIGYDSTGNRPRNDIVNEEGVVTREGIAFKEGIDPVFQYVYEVIDVWPYHNSAGAYANTVGGIFYCWYGAIDRSNRVVWSHENAHNQDGTFFLDGAGTRVGTVYEMSTDGFITQDWGSYNIHANYMLDFDITKDLQTNLTPSRINGRDKIESFYRNTFDVYDMLTYLEGNAFLKLNPEQQSKIGVQVEETRFDGTASGNFNRVTALNPVSKETYESWNLQSLADLWDKKLVSARNVAARSLSGSTNYVGGSPWYTSNYDNGLAESAYRLVAYELLGEKGYNAYVAYGSGSKYDFETKNLFRNANGGIVKGQTDVQIMQGIMNSESDDPWKEYQLEKYEKIKNKLNTSPVDYKYLEDVLKESMIIDAKYNKGTSQDGLTFILRKFLTGYYKRITNDYEYNIFDVNPYTINTVNVYSAEDMMKYANKTSFNVNFVLKNDIDFSDIEVATETYLKNFTGTITGNGHKIKGLKKPLFEFVIYTYVNDVTFENIDINASTMNIGLISKTITSSVIENIRLDNVNVRTTGVHEQWWVANTNAGSLAGQATYCIIKGVEANNLNVYGQGHDVGGLFGRLNSSYVEDVHINSGSVNGNARVGGIAGYALEIIELNKTSINIDLTARGNEAGGIFGQAANVNIVDSYVIGSMNIRDYSGGLIGRVNTSDSKTYSTITNGFSNAVITSNSNNAGGIIGYGENTVKVNNIVAFGKISGGYKFDGRSSQEVIDNYSNNYELKESIGYITKDRGGLNLTDKITIISIDDITNTDFYQTTLGWSNSVWDFTNVSIGGLPKLRSDKDTNNETSILDWIEISTLEEFLTLIPENLDKTFSLKNDIDMSSFTDRDIVFEGVFTGNIEGNNHAIKNLNNAVLFENFNGMARNLKIIDSSNEKPLNTTSDSAIFAYRTNNAILTNVHFDNVVVRGQHRVAVVSSMDQSNSTFNRVSVTNARVEGTGVYVSIFVGREYGGKFKNCYVEGNLIVNSTEAGGITGASHNNGTYENVISNVNIERLKNTDTAGRNNNGGFVGNIYNSPRLKNSIYIGNITGYEADGMTIYTYKFSGANLTQNEATIENCYELSDKTGFDSLLDTSTTAVKTTTSNDIKNIDFYKNTLSFDEEIWDFSTITEKGYPTLKNYK